MGAKLAILQLLLLGGRATDRIDYSIDRAQEFAAQRRGTLCTAADRGTEFGGKSRGVEFSGHNRGTEFSGQERGTEFTATERRE